MLGLGCNSSTGLVWGPLDFVEERVCEGDTYRFDQTCVAPGNYFF